MVGHLMAEAEGASVRLRRIARDKGTPAAARVEAERATWGIHVDLVRLLQGLGYLPQAPRPVSARVRFGQEDEGDAPEVEELMAELTRIEAIAGGGAGSGLAEGASGASDGGDASGGGEGGGTASGGSGGSQLGMLRSDLGRLVIAARIAAIGTLVDQQESATRKDSSNDDDDEADDQEQHERIEAEAAHEEEHEHEQPRERRATRSARGTRTQAASRNPRAKGNTTVRPPHATPRRRTSA
jgi:hypothetical protein